MSIEAPGGMVFGGDELELNAGRPTVRLTVTNRGDRAIQVGSHFHFFEANAALRFDREAAFGMRLDIPSGTAVRFEAGQTHEVGLVTFGGVQRLLGANGLTNGEPREQAFERARKQGFTA